MKHILLGAIFLIALLAIVPTASADSFIFWFTGDISAAFNLGVFGSTQFLFFDTESCDISVHNTNGLSNFLNFGGLIGLFAVHVAVNTYNVFGLLPTGGILPLGIFIVNVGC